MSKTAIRTDFPRKVREIENLWIPMPDGVRLAARIWLPEDADAAPVPAILEYLPYRKRDGTVERDHITHPYFAGHGYAAVRVDMRGTGDSEGVCLGEYLQQEQDDALAVITWLAEQDWCSGHVGMIGISWGGFNGLQVAALRPPALKAVITLCSTDDRYADDIHFMGGALLTDKLAWGATAFGVAMTPPDPAIVGARWREMWLERLEHNGLWMRDWFEHQRRDAFYRHGSICERYEDIEVPVFAVGGWVDGYTNAVFRLLENLSCPRKGLVGPWAHRYPHLAEPGPRIGFLQECLRWWDQHLKGIETGIMDEPALRAWIQDPAPPAPIYASRPGAWAAETAWPAPSVESKRFGLAQGRLIAGPGVPDRITIRSPQTTGMAAQSWCAYARLPDLALDQRAEVAGSVLFETDPLAEDMTVLGFPVLAARVSCDRPVAILAAVLSAVRPDGAATMISYGLLNLAHRDGHAMPQPMAPGQAADIRLQLNACGQRIAKGERIRLALSSAYWPLAWPAPEAASITIETGHSGLDLPLRLGPGADVALTPFGPAEGAAPVESTTIAHPRAERSVTIDQITGITTYRRALDSGCVRHHHTGLELGESNTDVFSIHPDDPNSATGTCRWVKTYQRGDWRAGIDAEITVSALREVWRIEAKLSATDADGEAFARTWAEDIPRDFT